MFPEEKDKGCFEMKQGKIWGNDDDIFQNMNVSVHYLDIKKGGFSSEHLHIHKANLFYVISGELEITIWREKGMKDITVLRAGDSSAVASGFYHKFRALSDVQCIEIYQVFMQGPDIERRTQGGITGGKDA